MADLEDHDGWVLSTYFVWKLLGEARETIGGREDP